MEMEAAHIVALLVTGVFVGFASGLLQDIFSVGLLGVNAFIKTIAGFFCGLLKERMFAEHILFIIPLLTLLITIMKSIVLYLVLHVFGMETNTLLWSLKQIVFPEALYNGLLSPFIYIGVKKYLQIIEDRF